MASDNRSSTYLTVAAVTFAAGLAAYAVYFDYKRRNDVDFRKKLKKEKKRVQKAVAEDKLSTEAATATLAGVTPATLKSAIQTIRAEQPPRTPEEQEQFFMAQIAMGEKLAAEGPESYLPSAMAFFRALRVYPAPVELIVIYEKTIVEPVFKLIMDLTQLDVNHRIEAYYDYFPPKKMNVAVQVRDSVQGSTSRQVLVATEDFAAGDVIYKEFPIVSVLDPDLQDKGTYCGHCLRRLEGEMALSIPDDSANSAFPLTYCSKVCMLASKKQYQSVLFTLDPALPAEIPTEPITPDAQEARRDAQIKFAEYIKQSEKAIPLLVARFVGRQIANETQKITQASSLSSAASGANGSDNDYTDAEDVSEKYGLADHLERLRYLEFHPDATETELFTKVLQTALPGLESFVTFERFSTLKGKMAYNAFGVCYNGGRDDKPAPTARPEDVEKTRTPYGTQRQVGSAVYTVSSYLIHSCNPSVRPSYSSGTSEVAIIANRDIKKGDVLTSAFVDVKQHEGESVIECRRRRRIELARGWRFSCGCERCIEEANAMSAEEKAAAPADQKDESKVEESVRKYALGQEQAKEKEIEEGIDL